MLIRVWLVRKTTGEPIDDPRAVSAFRFPARPKQSAMLCGKEDYG